MKVEFSRKMFEKPKYQISSKSVQWESSCSMLTDRQADRQTDMTKLTVSFRSFTNTPKNETKNNYTVS
jgi:hypothetical protein